MKNTIIHLIGFPGTGKYTIAKEIVALEKCRLIDNHLINNPVFSVIRKDGKSKIPPRAWKNIRKIWDAVLDTMINIAEKDENFILTNVLVEESKSDKKLIKKRKWLVKKRGATYVPIRLTCSLEEMQKRVISPDREVKMKMTNVETLNNLAKKSLIDPKHKNTMTLDVTNLSPQEAAKIILQHAKNCAQN